MNRIPINASAILTTSKSSGSTQLRWRAIVRGREGERERERERKKEKEKSRERTLNRTSESH